MDRSCNSSMQDAENMKRRLQPQQKFTPTKLLTVRLAYLILIWLCYWSTDTIQSSIDSLWDYLRDQWWFRTVYFETILTVVYYIPWAFTFYYLNKSPHLDMYRVEPEGGRMAPETVSSIAGYSYEYVLPLAILDTCHVKHFYGVSDDVIADKWKNWIQRTRALPDFAPKFQDVALHIFVALVIYDALFFIMHYYLHEHPTLYRMFHKKHHTHDVISAKETHNLHLVERMAIILSANAGLKVQGAHPFTRMIFVFIFVGFQLYNHCGYDFPWALDKVIPFGIVSGAREHYVHHAEGKRHYAFIFTYLDNALDFWTRRQKMNKKPSA